MRRYLGNRVEKGVNKEFSKVLKAPHCMLTVQYQLYVSYMEIGKNYSRARRSIGPTKFFIPNI